MAVNAILPTAIEEADVLRDGVRTENGPEPRGKDRPHGLARRVLARCSDDRSMVRKAPRWRRTVQAIGQDAERIIAGCPENVCLSHRRAAPGTGRQMGRKSAFRQKGLSHAARGAGRSNRVGQEALGAPQGSVDSLLPSWRQRRQIRCPSVAATVARHGNDGGALRDEPAAVVMALGTPNR